MPYKDPEAERAYQRSYYANNPDYREKQNLRTAKNTALRRESVLKVVVELKSHPCTDCGNKFPPICMDFDHISRNKVANVSRMVRQGSSLETVLAEIAKCELVCANCHRVRTRDRRIKTNVDCPEGVIDPIKSGLGY